MKKIIILIFCLLIGLSACSKTENPKKVDTATTDDYDVGEDIKVENNTMNISINNITYTVDLVENETSKALLEHLPLTLEMNELNGNEKCSNLDFTLPVHSENVMEIKEGDIMLFGDNCLVLFYKSFETTYEYTPIGHIQDPKGLAEAVGVNNITVNFY